MGTSVMILSKGLSAPHLWLNTDMLPTISGNSALARLKLKRISRSETTTTLATSLK